MLSVLRSFNQALRVVMELCIIAALGYWGYQSSAGLIPRILLTIGAPVLGFGVWSMVDLHQAGRWSEFLRLIEELVISGLAALALYTVGEQALAWGLGALSIVHHAFVYLLGGRLLKG